MYLPINCFHLGITGIVRRTVGGVGGFEERRKGERFKLALPVQLKNGTGMTRDISTSGIFFETESAYSIGDTIRLLLNFEHETLQCEARVVSSFNWVRVINWGRALDFDIWREKVGNLFIPQRIRRPRTFKRIGSGR